MRDWTPLEVVLLFVATGQGGVIAVLALVVRDLARRPVQEPPPESAPEPVTSSRPVGFRAR